MDSDLAKKDRGMNKPVRYDVFERGEVIMEGWFNKSPPGPKLHQFDSWHSRYFALMKIDYFGVRSVRFHVVKGKRTLFDLVNFRYFLVYWLSDEEKMCRKKPIRLFPLTSEGGGTPCLREHPIWPKIDKFVIAIDIEDRRLFLCAPNELQLNLWYDAMLESLMKDSAPTSDCNMWNETASEVNDVSDATDEHENEDGVFQINESGFGSFSEQVLEELSRSTTISFPSLEERLTVKTPKRKRSSTWSTFDGSEADEIITPICCRISIDDEQTENQDVSVESEKHARIDRMNSIDFYIKMEPFIEQNNLTVPNIIEEEGSDSSQVQHEVVKSQKKRFSYKKKFKLPVRRYSPEQEIEGNLTRGSKRMSLPITKDPFQTYQRRVQSFSFQNEHNVFKRKPCYTKKSKFPSFNRSGPNTTNERSTLSNALEKSNTVQEIINTVLPETKENVSGEILNGIPDVYAEFNDHPADSLESTSASPDVESFETCADLSIMNEVRSMDTSVCTLDSESFQSYNDTISTESTCSNSSYKCISVGDVQVRFPTKSLMKLSNQTVEINTKMVQCVINIQNTERNLIEELIVDTQSLKFTDGYDSKTSLL